MEIDSGDMTLACDHGKLGSGRSRWAERSWDRVERDGNVMIRKDTSQSRDEILYETSCLGIVADSAFLGDAPASCA